MRNPAPLLALAGIIVGLYGCLQAVKSNGATEHPLLVDDQPQPVTPAKVRHGFVCTPTTTPRIAPERTQEIV